MEIASFKYEQTYTKSNHSRALLLTRIRVIILTQPQNNKKVFKNTEGRCSPNPYINACKRMIQAKIATIIEYTTSLNTTGLELFGNRSAYCFYNFYLFMVMVME